MVPPDSREIPRVPRYSGQPHTSATLTVTGLSPTPVRLPRRFTFTQHFSLANPAAAEPQGPHNPAHATPAGLNTHTRFSLLRFRSPLLTESHLFSLPTGTKMFHFPALPPTPLYIQGRATGHYSGHSRFPHSDTPGSQLAHQLPRAYRRSQRPSSALGAKASTDRTTQLCTTPRRTNTYNNKDTRIHYTVLNHHTNTTSRTHARNTAPHRPPHM